MLREEEAPERHFPQWTMGFRDLAAETAATPGFDPFLKTPLTAHAFGPDPAKAQKLLLMFKKNL